MAGATGTVENPLLEVFEKRMGGGEDPSPSPPPSGAEGRVGRVETPDTGGFDLLTRYFQEAPSGPDKKEPDVPAAGPGASGAPGEMGDPTEVSTPPAPGVDSFDPSSPLFQSAIEQGVNSRLQQLQWEQMAERRQQALNNLSDAEYGRLHRQESSLLAQRQTMAEQIGANFFHQAWTDVLSHKDLPELKEWEKKNPAESFKSFSDIVASQVNHVANARAEKLAEGLVEKKVEAKLRTEMSKLRKAHPEINFGGPNTASGRQAGVSRENMSGMQLLEAGIAARG